MVTDSDMLVFSDIRKIQSSINDVYLVTRIFDYCVSLGYSK